MAQYTDPNRPDPNGPRPAGVSDASWYGYTKVDSSVPLDQWKQYDQFYVPGASGYERYKSTKINPETGQPFTELVEKPPNTPNGWVAYGANGAIRSDDPRATGITSGSNGGNSAGSNTPPPAPPPLQWDSSGNYNPNGVGSAESNTSPLQSQLEQMFANRSSLFGDTNGRTPTGTNFQGTMQVDGNGNPLPQAPNLNGRSLSGGGLLWSAGGDLSDWGGNNPAPAPAPQGGGGGPSPLTSALTAAKTPNPNAPPSYASGWTNNTNNTFTPNPASGLNGLGFNNGLPTYNFFGQPVGSNMANNTPQSNPVANSPLTNALTQQKKAAPNPFNPANTVNRNNQYTF